MGLKHEIEAFTKKWNDGDKFGFAVPYSTTVGELADCAGQFREIRWESDGIWVFMDGMKLLGAYQDRMAETRKKRELDEMQ